MPVRWPYRTRRPPISIISGPWRSVIGACPAAAAGAHGKSYAAGEFVGPFFVEDIKCYQANVRDFLLTQSDFVAHTVVPRQHIRCRSAGCRRYTACQRQRQPGGPQNRYDFATRLLLAPRVTPSPGLVAVKFLALFRLFHKKRAVTPITPEDFAKSQLTKKQIFRLWKCAVKDRRAGNEKVQ